jgi:hypothetical protein
MKDFYKKKGFWIAMLGLAAVVLGLDPEIRDAVSSVIESAYE